MANVQNEKVVQSVADGVREAVDALIGLNGRLENNSVTTYLHS